MKAFKSATAGVKESVQNVKAKADQHKELNKASSQAKTDLKEADTKIGKHEAKANHHTRQAEIHREYEQKLADNRAAKDETRAALHQKKADKKAGKNADKTDGEVGDDEQTTPTPAADEETVDEENTSPNVDSDVPEQAQDRPEARENVTDTNPELREDVTDANPEAREDVTDANPDSSSADAADSDTVPKSEVPMHGSGVPTHSEVHSNNTDNTHDARTTQTMNGSSNTGSYM